MPDRSFHPAVWHSAGSGLFGTAPDYLIFLTALGEGRLLRPDTLAEAAIDHAAGMPMPAWNLGKGHGLVSGLLVDPAANGSALPAGTWEWSGLYGTSWFVDPANRIAVSALTNTGLEGCMGRFPADIARAIYRH
jgi:CubicO group peptidase (beta-lactamase class C family)